MSFRDNGVCRWLVLTPKVVEYHLLQIQTECGSTATKKALGMSMTADFAFKIMMEALPWTSASNPCLIRLGSDPVVGSDPVDLVWIHQ